MIVILGFAVSHETVIALLIVAWFLWPRFYDDVLEKKR
jgi:hypothetical protein